MYLKQPVLFCWTCFCVMAWYNAHYACASYVLFVLDWTGYYSTESWDYNLPEDDSGGNRFWKISHSETILCHTKFKTASTAYKAFWLKVGLKETTVKLSTRLIIYIMEVQHQDVFWSHKYLPKNAKVFCFDTAQHDVTSHAYPISARMWIVHCFCLYFRFLMVTVDVNISFFFFC